MRAYVLLRTRYGTTKKIIDDLRKNHEQNFLQGNTVYGWYDALIELKIPFYSKLMEIVDEMKNNYTDIMHIKVTVERIKDYPSLLQYVT